VDLAREMWTLYEPVHQILMTGDLLFVGKVGGTRTDRDAEIVGLLHAKKNRLMGESGAILINR